MILFIQFLTFHIESERIAVNPIKIISLTWNQFTICIKNWLACVFVMLENKIPPRFSIIRIFTCYVFEYRHENLLMCDKEVKEV